MKKLILHIGAGKTGTSSIQGFMAKHVDKIAQDGFIVPSSDLKHTGNVTGEHVWYLNKLSKHSPGSGSKVLREDLLSYLNKIQGDFHSVILSAENLSDNLNWVDLFTKLQTLFKIEIIFYIRRQDEYLLSAWQQWYVKNDNDFWAWLLRVSGILGDWKKIIENWEDLVGMENITVRKFERKYLHNMDVISDFCQTIGLPESYSRLALNHPRNNTSFNHGVQGFVEENSNLFENSHDNGFYNFMARFAPSSMKISKHSIITHKQRLSLIYKYQSSNEWIRKKFFPQRQGNTLFDMPKPEDYKVLTKYEIEELKKTVMIEAIYNMYKMNK